jgi:hypothetical protein
MDLFPQIPLVSFLSELANCIGMGVLFSWFIIADPHNGYQDSRALNLSRFEGKAIARLYRAEWNNRTLRDRGLLPPPRRPTHAPRQIARFPRLPHGYRAAPVGSASPPPNAASFSIEIFLSARFRPDPDRFRCPPIRGHIWGDWRGAGELRRVQWLFFRER